MNGDTRLEGVTGLQENDVKTLVGAGVHTAEELWNRLSESPTFLTERLATDDAARIAAALSPITLDAARAIVPDGPKTDPVFKALAVALVIATAIILDRARPQAIVLRATRDLGSFEIVTADNIRAEDGAARSLDTLDVLHHFTTRPFATGDVIERSMLSDKALDDPTRRILEVTLDSDQGLAGLRLPVTVDLVATWASPGSKVDRLQDVALMQVQRLGDRVSAIVAVKMDRLDEFQQYARGAKLVPVLPPR